MQDAVNLWLGNAARQPIPSKREQLELARLVQRGRQPDATRAELRAARRAKDRLVAGNLRLIVPIARKFGRRIQGSSLGMEDLLQAGTYGLIRAVELFDPERGYSLTTPSYWWISQAIRRAVQDSAQPIRAPIHAQDLCRRWRYRPEGQTVDEFCAEWGITPAKLGQELEQAARARCCSLDAKLATADGDGTLLDVVADPDHQPSTSALELEQAVGRLGVLPDDLALVEESLATTLKELAARHDMHRDTMRSALNQARKRLAAVAGPGARALLVA
jgi:RNA polymerase primary sigma factor